MWQCDVEWGGCDCWELDLWCCGLKWWLGNRSLHLIRVPTSYMMIYKNVILNFTAYASKQRGYTRCAKVWYHCINCHGPRVIGAPCWGKWRWSERGWLLLLMVILLCMADILFTAILIHSGNAEVQPRYAPWHSRARLWDFRLSQPSIFNFPRIVVCRLICQLTSQDSENKFKLRTTCYWTSSYH